VDLVRRQEVTHLAEARELVAELGGEEYGRVEEQRALGDADYRHTRGEGEAEEANAAVGHEQALSQL
jgi:hypothetical protein